VLLLVIQIISVNYSMISNMTTTKVLKPSLLQAFIPIIALIFFLTINIYFWGDDSLNGANQLALLFAAVIAGIISMRLNVSFSDIQSKIINTISDAMPSVLILFLIGSLSGTWMLSGVVPTLIVYGLDLLNPSVFLLASVLISSIVSVATGSSWSTIATIGVALMGIGTALGFSQAMIAGAVISGAYFGDKISPLSDTTNLAPAMAGGDLFTHIKYMLNTTIPSFVLTFIFFLILGFIFTPEYQSVGVDSIENSIKSNFHVTPWLLLVPALLIFLIVTKVPPLIALFISALSASLAALIFQSTLLNPKSSTELLDVMQMYYTQISQAWFGEYNYHTGNISVDNLLETGGMAGMLNTVWLIIMAMVFSGVMEAGQLLKRIANAIIEKVNSTGSLVLATVTTSIFMNITAADQYISIVVPGRMYADIYKRRGYKPELLSRSLEDGGTVTSVLVPWNTCGAVNSTVLGVSTLSYLPFAFFNLISPLMSVLMAYLNIKIRRYTSEEQSVLMAIENEQQATGI